MSKPIEIATELKKELDNLPLFQEYKRLREAVDSDKDISELKTAIAKAKAQGNEDLHKELLERYNSHPLIINLNIIESEVADYLNQISVIVNKK